LSVYLIRGDVYRALGKLEESVDDFDRVIHSTPEEAMAYIGRGDTRSLLHDTEGAKRDYARAIAINPSLIAFCPEIETESEKAIVSFASPIDIHHSFFEDSKITLSRRLKKLKHFYRRFKVLIDSSLNFVILCLVLPVNELLADSLIAALIET